MQSIKEQYSKSDNLESRISLYQCSTNPMNLFQWIAEQFPTSIEKRVLELGCGTGLLWQSLREKITPGNVILSDLSQGMINTSFDNLGDDFSYKIIDYHDIPYGDNSFDIIISNHNLYHSDNLDMVLNEIRRVLKRDGQFYCTTNGRNHLFEIKEILGRYGIAGLWPNQDLMEKFGLQNGEDKLGPYFNKREKRIYPSELHIKKAELIINYFLSVRNPQINMMMQQNREEILAKISSLIEREGYFRVQTECGLFIASS